MIDDRLELVLRDARRERPHGGFERRAPAHAG
jgi:hypothetical protein